MKSFSEDELILNVVEKDETIWGGHIIHHGTKLKSNYRWIDKRKSYFADDESILYEVANFDSNGKYIGLVIQYDQHGRQIAKLDYLNGVMITGIEKTFYSDSLIYPEDAIYSIKITEGNLILEMQWDKCENLIRLIKSRRTTAESFLEEIEIENIQFYPNGPDIHSKYMSKMNLVKNGNNEEKLDKLHVNFFSDGNIQCRTLLSADNTINIYESWERDQTKLLSHQI